MVNANTNTPANNSTPINIGGIADASAQNNTQQPMAKMPDNSKNKPSSNTKKSVWR